MEYMDFFDALREVVGTDRGIKTKDAADWSLYHPGKSPSGLYDGAGFLIAPSLNNSTGKEWWPKIEQQKEKIWQTDTAAEELVDFPEAFVAALEGKKIDIYPGENWSRYVGQFLRDSHGGRAALVDQNDKYWWPTSEQIKGKWWIETVEQKKEPEVFVWGFCAGPHNSSFLMTKYPCDDITSGDWQDHIGDDGSNILELYSERLFPKDKPQKFKLVPVED